MANKLEGQMDFLGLISEYTDDQGATVRVKAPGEAPRKETAAGAVKKPKNSFDRSTLAGQLKLEFIDLDAEFEAEQNLAANDEAEQNHTANVEAETVEEVMAGIEPVTSTLAGDLLFKQCKRCWCRDCKHNSRNKGVPREMCGAMIPCPACDSCIAEDMATICEIGNAEEGCMFRAVEDGYVSNLEEI